jgi:glutathione S-transferase
MRSLLDVLAFRYWLISLVVLFVKMYANSVVQGLTRFRTRSFAWPEDAAMFRDARVVERDPEMVERAARCWRNDLENIPIYLFLGLGFVLAGGLPWWAALYFTVFTLARIAHTFCYLRGLQPWRNVAYQVGVLVCFALAVHIVVLLLTVRPL